MTAAVVVLAVACAGPEEVSRAPRPASVPEWQVDTSRVELGDQPYALYADASALWVSGGRGHVLEVRDRRVARYAHPTGPLGITVVDGEVWTTASSEHRHAAGAVVVLDSETGDVVRTIRLPGDSPYGIDHAGGDVFVALHDGELLRIDRTGDPVSRVRLGNGVTQVVATDEAVWVSQPGAGVVWRVELDGDEAAAEPVALGRRGTRSCPQGSDEGRRFVLVADSCAGRVWLVDPRSGEVAGAVSDAGEKPVDVAVDAGLIYVVSMAEDQVTVLDESTLDELAVAQAGQGAISVAAAAGIAWVANLDEDTVTRIEVRRRDG